MEPKLNQFIQAVEQATLPQIEAIAYLDTLQIKESKEYAFYIAFGLLVDDIDVVSSWLKYAILGLVSINNAVNSILANTQSEEGYLLAYFSNIIANYPEELQKQILTHPINKDLAQELPQFTDAIIKKTKINQSKDTTEILSSLAKPNSGDINNDTQNIITKDDILAGIENPTETVKVPTFALPKSKPQTTNILSSLAKPADPAKVIDLDGIQAGGDADILLDAIVDPFMESIGNNTQTPNHVHSSKSEGTSTVDILSQATTPQLPNTPAQKILQTLDTKLQQVQGTSPTETYKVASTPKHDPYREMPSL